MPPNTVKVDRTTKWGNPFITGEHGTRAHCVGLFRALLGGFICLSNGPSIADQEQALAAIKAGLPTLHGKNLACWCPQGAPCHADVLIELANLPVVD